MSNLTSGGTYTVWVTSLFATGESAPSPPVSLLLPSSLSRDTAVPKHRSPSVSLHFPSPPNGGTRTPEHRHSQTVALNLPFPSTSSTSSPSRHISLATNTVPAAVPVPDSASDAALDPARGQRRPPPGHIWLAAVVSALVLLTLTGLAISGWVRHLRGKQQTGAYRGEQARNPDRLG